jgi:hypothetical protein
MAVAGGILLVILAASSFLGREGSNRAPIEVSGQPRLKVDRTGLDLGDVPLGTTVEASFVLTNVGDQPLRLTRAPYIEVLEGC